VRQQPTSYSTLRTLSAGLFLPAAEGHYYESVEISLQQSSRVHSTVRPFLTQSTKNVSPTHSKGRTAAPYLVPKTEM